MVNGSQSNEFLYDCSWNKHANDNLQKQDQPVVAVSVEVSPASFPVYLIESGVRKEINPFVTKDV